MMIKDETVSIVGLRPELIVGMMICNQVLQDHGYELVITSAAEQHTKHGETSLHYPGFAIDMRSQHIETQAEKTLILNEMKQKLSVDFDVLLEGEGKPYEHFHLEFQPKRRDNLVNR